MTWHTHPTPSLSIGLFGKGSSGKSTLVWAWARSLLAAASPTHPLLLVDSDPNGSLSLLLGQTAAAQERNLGILRRRYEQSAARWIADESAVERAERAMTEEALVPLIPGADLLWIGEWGLEGSECTPNRVMAHALAGLPARYRVTLIDHEAGLETMGRYAAIPLSHAVFVAHPTCHFLQIARKIWERAQALQRPIEQGWLLVNRGDLVGVDLAQEVALLRAAGLPLLATLPLSPALVVENHQAAIEESWMTQATAALNVLVPPTP